MDGRVCVDLPDDLQKRILCSIFGQKELLYGDAHLTAAGQDAFFVGKVVRAGTHAHHGQRGHDALFLHCSAAGGVCFVHGGHNGRALQNRCHQNYPLNECVSFS